MNRLMMVAAPAALACAIAATAAIAQPAPRPAGPPGGPPGGEAMMAEMKAMHDAMVKQHTEDLKTILRLRPDQEPALAAFLAAHGPRRFEIHKVGPGDAPSGGPGGVEVRRYEFRGPGGPGGHSPMGMGKPMTTPERLDQMAKRDAAMAAEHEKDRAALAKFYAALSPEQQKVFDALQRMHGPGGGHGDGHAGGPGGPGVKRIMIHRGPGGPGGPDRPGEHGDHR